MSTTKAYEQLREQALARTPEQRIELAHDLLDSVVPEDEHPAEIEAAWADEIKERDSGLAETIPAAHVFARARERVRDFAGAHAPNLSTEERVELAQELLDSVELEEGDEDDAAAEIKRRVDEIRAGTAVTYDAEEVMAELRARYG